MQLCEYLYFCPQQFRNNRNGNVIHGTMLVSLELIQIRHADIGDENDRYVLEAGVFVDHLSDSKPSIPACSRP